MNTRKALGLALLGCLFTAGWTACSGVDPESIREDGFAVQWIGNQESNDFKPALSTPVVSIAAATETSIDVQVCAGATGAPAGFSLQWMDADAYTSGGGFSSLDPSYCAASFSGVPAQSVFSLDPGECRAVTVGGLDDAQVGVSFHDGCNDGLTCGTEYAFRAFAHGSSDFNRSPFSATVFGSTLACDDGDGCTFTQGYWKTHDGSPNPDVWPVSSLALGSVSYDQAQLSAIFDTAVKGNGLTSLAHQLIAAKLNIANGADPSAISGSVAAADAMIGGLVIPSVGSGYLAPATTSALVGALASYNEGTTGPGHCDDGASLTSNRGVRQFE